MERVKLIPRNAASAESDAYRPELITDDEPRYLRRQKPVEIRRKKFSGRGWLFYRRLLVCVSLGLAGALAANYAVRFLLYSPGMLLLKPDQITVNGNHMVSRDAVLQQFVQDRNHSVLLVPLDVRRADLEKIPWVESASVQRILPNRLRVEVTERTPMAFARSGSELALIDAHGVLLDRPQDEDLHFPIVSGVSEDLPREQREKRMQICQEFMRAVELVRAGSSDRISEMDISNPKDLRVVMTGLAKLGDQQAVTIHFGSGEFAGKFKMLVDNFSQWQANAGHVESIDLQYSRQVVVNPDESPGPAAGRRK